MEVIIYNSRHISCFTGSNNCGEFFSVNEPDIKTVAPGLQSLYDQTVNPVSLSLKLGCVSQPLSWTCGTHWIGRMLALVFMAVCFWSPSNVSAAQVKLAWDAIEYSALADYRVYARLSGQNYDSEPAWTGKSSSCSINNLIANKSYCFVVRASNINGNESDNSNEVCYQIGTGGENQPADTDTDGLPDEWETKMGLDPSKNDADADLDGDAISNADEFELGSDPAVPADNLPPQSPICKYPLDGDQVDSLAPEFEMEAFSDSDPGDAHFKTQWRIVRAFDDVCVFDVRSIYYLTQIKIPHWVLESETEYYLQVRFLDKQGARSEWSEKITFETPTDLDDRDGNGVIDAQQVNENIDLNGDGIIDTTQPDTIKCVTSDSSPGVLGLSVDNAQGTTLVSGMSNENPEEDTQSLTESVTLPYGLFEYKVEVAQPGSTIQIKIFLPDAAADDLRWHHLDIDGSWINYSAYAQLGSDRKTVTLELKDGGYGDIDGVENGVVVDRSGLMPTPQSSGGASSVDWGGSGACFISASQEPNSVEKFYLWLAGVGIAMIILGKIAAIWHEKYPGTKKAQS
jgi:hypothetical protein